MEKTYITRLDSLCSKSYDELLDIAHFLRSHLSSMDNIYIIREEKNSFLFVVPEKYAVSFETSLKIHNFSYRLY